MTHQRQCPTRPTIVPTIMPMTSSTLLGTSLLVTRSPRHNRALAGLMRTPTGRIT